MPRRRRARRVAGTEVARCVGETDAAVCAVTETAPALRRQASITPHSMPGKHSRFPCSVISWISTLFFAAFVIFAAKLSDPPAQSIAQPRIGRARILFLVAA